MSDAIVKRNRWKGLLIIGVIFLPMVMAYVMYHTGWGIPAGTTNKGILLSPPKAVSELVLQENPSLLSSLYQPDQHKRWRLLVPVSEPCHERCENNLYVTRQVHIRLAEKAYRVERILLLLDDLDKEKRQALIAEHPGTQIALSHREYLQQWLAGESLVDAPENVYFLIDQNGYAMMTYNQKHTGHDLLDDLKKLLKFTYDK